MVWIDDVWFRFNFNGLEDVESSSLLFYESSVIFHDIEIIIEWFKSFSYLYKCGSHSFIFIDFNITRGSKERELICYDEKKNNLFSTRSQGKAFYE